MLLGFEPRDFLFGQGSHFRIAGLEQIAVAGEFVGHLEIRGAGGAEFLEARVFPAQLLRALRLGKSFRRAQEGFNLGKALEEFFDVRAQVHFILTADK